MLAYMPDSKRVARAAWYALLQALIALALTLALTVTLSACQQANNAAEQVGDASIQSAASAAVALDGDMQGTVGTTYATRWFEFTIHSVDTVTSYQGYAAKPESRLVVVSITETCTFDTETPFGTFDWFVDDDAFDDFLLPLEPFAAGMMPVSFTLNPNQSAVFDLVFEVPTHATNPQLCYVETDVSGESHASVSIPLR